MLKSKHFLKWFVCLSSLVAFALFLPISTTASPVGLSRVPAMLVSLSDDGDDEATEMTERMADQSDIVGVADKAPLDSGWKRWLGKHRYGVAFLPKKELAACSLRSAQVVIRDDGHAKFRGILSLKNPSLHKAWHFYIDLFGPGGWWSYGEFDSPTITAAKNGKNWAFEFDWRHREGVDIPFRSYRDVKKAKMTLPGC